MDLKGKVAIVTGAGSGIGRATALELAREGSVCVLVARSPDKLRAALDDVRALSPTSTAEVCDVGDPRRTGLG